MKQLSDRHIWFAFAQCWVDMPLADTSFPRHAKRIQRASISRWRYFFLVRWRICSVFAIESSFMFMSAGMSLSDWFFSERELLRMLRCWRKHKWMYLHLLNPLWWFGFVVAQWFIGNAQREVSRILFADDPE